MFHRTGPTWRGAAGPGTLLDRVRSVERLVARSAADQAGYQSTTRRDRLVESLEEQVDCLREQLREEREAHRKARRIIAMLVSRVPELESRRDTLLEALESPETVAQGSDRG